MSFFDTMKAKYQLHLSREQIESEEFEKFVELNFTQADHIEKDGEMLNIYVDKVSLSDIFRFLKKRLPGTKWTVDDELLRLKDPEKIMKAKFMVFSTLAGLLEYRSSVYGTERNKLPAGPNEEDHDRDKTIH